MKINSILLMGTSDFAVPIIDKIQQNFFNELKCVITQPDTPSGRGQKQNSSPVKTFCLAKNINFSTPNDKNELINETKKYNPDLIIVVSYGNYIPKEITENFYCINIHPSLLPKYRGASPIQTAFLNGDKTTGISIITVAPKMDAGDILLQQSVPIFENENFGSLHNRLSQISSDMCLDFIQKNLKTDSVKPITQDESKVTFCSKIEKEDLFLNLSDSAETFINKVRAFSPKPGAYIMFECKRIKIIDATIKNGQIELLQVQPEGKKAMSFYDFCLGNPAAKNLLERI